MSKLKKVIKVTAKGVGTLISEVLARTFSYSFEHTSYIIYWYQNPHGTRAEADKFCIDNGQYIIDNIDGLVDGVLDKVAEKLGIDNHPEKKHHHYCGECKYFALCNDEATKRDNAGLDPYSDACNEFEEV